MTLAAPRQLREMLTALRAECGHSLSVAHGLNERDALVYLLNRTQLDLLEDYDWPILEVDRPVALTAGVRFYAYPDDLPFEQINKVWAVANFQVYALDYGIDPTHYFAVNSLTGMRSWPPMRWRHNADDGTFEVWPIPDDSATGANLTLRGIRAPVEMVSDSDVSTLPWRIIVLSAAAEVLSRQQDPSAAAKASRAAELLRRLKVRQSAHKTGTVHLGTGGLGRPAPRVGLDYIPTGYGSGPRRV